MSPLERRYRRLLRLLPAEHRDARGEELLGMLLDLDDGRNRPSVRQAGGVVALALRLRFVHLGSLLLAALLIAFSTSGVASTVTFVHGSVVVIASDPVLYWSVFAAGILVRLAGAVAWVLGARMVALISYAAVVAGLLAAGLGVVLVDLFALMVLGVAVWRRWPAPGARPVLLMAFPLAMALWWLTAAWGREVIYSPEITPGMTWSFAVVGVGVGWLLTRRRSRTTRVVVVLCGGFAPAVIPDVIFGPHSRLLSIVVVVTLLGIAGGALRSRSTAVPRTAGRSPRGTTE